MANDRPIVVDGSNVAFATPTKHGDARVSNLTAVRKALRERGFRPIIIVDASLRHHIDDPDQLETLIDDGTVLQAPAGTDADYFVLETADREGAPVISNDRFQDRQGTYPWVKERIVPLMIVGDEVELYPERLDEALHARPDGKAGGS